VLRLTHLIISLSSFPPSFSSFSSASGCYVTEETISAAHMCCYFSCALLFSHSLRFFLLTSSKSYKFFHTEFVFSAVLSFSVLESVRIVSLTLGRIFLHNLTSINDFTCNYTVETPCITSSNAISSPKCQIFICISKNS
jgi:hypothetical protein